MQSEDAEKIYNVIIIELGHNDHGNNEITAIANKSVTDFS